MTHITLLNRLDVLKDETLKSASISLAQKIKSLADLLVEVELMTSSYNACSAKEVWDKEKIPYDERRAQEREAEEKRIPLTDDRSAYTTTGNTDIVSEATMESWKSNTVYTLTNMFREIMNEIRRLAGPMEKVPGLRD
jgi:hypothetical protein